MKIKVSIFLTASKIMAYVILIMAFILEFKYNIEGKIFLISLPAIYALIAGKQFLDRNKPDPESSEKIIDATIEKNKIEAEAK